VIVLLLWFYLSGLAILVGAELNAEIEHASPHGKDPGEKVPGEKKKIGAAAARAYKERLESRNSTAPMPTALPQPVAVFQASPSSSDRMLGNRRRTAATRHASLEPPAAWVGAGRPNERRHTMTTTKDERSLGEMFAEHSRETRTLVQRELQLARTELRAASGRRLGGARGRRSSTGRTGAGGP
jgi:hypothetical protein